ncbi:MAG: DEAD/DEAH box helicase [Bacteroidota bacterium]
MKFTEFNFKPEIIEGIKSLGFEDATPIQDEAIPKITEGKDIIASAQTGTGKTAAFLLPMINKLMGESDHDSIKALIIVPTRELAIQIDQQMEGFSYFTSISSIAVYGGGDGDLFTQEKQALSSGADVVICTVGRMTSHLNMGYVKLDKLQYLVLDEADRMLDMGFHDDIMRIISFLPKKRQNLLFSATMPIKIRDLARKILAEPEEISIAISKANERITQVAFIIYDSQKIPLALHFLKAKKFESVIVFCSTKLSTKQLTKELQKLGLDVESVHSDLDQKEREEALQKFKSKKLNILVATDILSRGIDIEDIDLVINYDVPNDGEDYIHRIGRTARAASNGAAFTFVGVQEQNKFQDIENLLGKPVPKANLPESFGDVPEYNPRKGRSGGKKPYRRKKS